MEQFSHSPPGDEMKYSHQELGYRVFVSVQSLSRDELNPVKKMVNILVLPWLPRGGYRISERGGGGGGGIRLS